MKSPELKHITYILNLLLGWIDLFHKIQEFLLDFGLPSWMLKANLSTSLLQLNVTRQYINTSFGPGFLFGK